MECRRETVTGLVENRAILVQTNPPLNPACWCMQTSTTKKSLFDLLEKLSSRAAANKMSRRALVSRKLRRCREC